MIKYQGWVGCGVWGVCDVILGVIKGGALGGVRESGEQHTMRKLHH